MSGIVRVDWFARDPGGGGTVHRVEPAACSGGNCSGVTFEDGTALVTGTWAGFTGELYDPLSGRSREARVRIPNAVLRQAARALAAEDEADDRAAVEALAEWEAEGYRTVPAEQVWAAETAEQP